MSDVLKDWKENDRKERRNHIIITIVVCAAIATAVFGIVVACQHSSRFERWRTDIRSNFTGGLERTINVYTANGDLIASYEGKIDIDDNEGGYIKFDYDGKRYIYYNCFVESIAKIDDE